MSPRALLLDLDDTLYDYLPNEQRGRRAMLGAVAHDLRIADDRAASLYDEARARVKQRLGKTGASHSRLLYLHELAHLADAARALRFVRGWERRFWQAYLEGARLRPDARPLLEGWRAQGNRVAIVTDLILEVQLWKLEAFGLLPLIDALVASEEVPRDKPEPAAFELALSRLGLAREQAVVVGDSEQKDGGGARALGVPFYRVRGTEAGGEGGMSLAEVAVALGGSP